MVLSHTHTYMYANDEKKKTHLRRISNRATEKKYIEVCTWSACWKWKRSQAQFDGCITINFWQSQIANFDSCVSILEYSEYNCAKFSFRHKMLLLVFQWARAAKSNRARVCAYHILLEVFHDIEKLNASLHWIQNYSTNTFYSPQLQSSSVERFSKRRRKKHTQKRIVLSLSNREKLKYQIGTRAHELYWHNIHIRQIYRRMECVCDKRMCVVTKKTGAYAFHLHRIECAPYNMIAAIDKERKKTLTLG